ncbi:MAG: hypothetical protein DMF98_14640 [Acidobacteria bacterium]|nr:MAG: hypothetical protein DMF98_14640 [Acidobacteriota bacterium]
MLIPGDDVKGAAPVAVISESMWEHRFGRTPSIIGEAVTLDARPFTIVGVMPAGFQFPIQAEPVEAWIPLGSVSLTAQWLEQRGAHFVEVVGRLAPGAGVTEANSEIATIAARLAASYPKSNTNRSASVRALQAELVREYRLGLVVLMCAVAAVLLIACANVANLLLARASVRRKEMAIRVAIGARRADLVRQLLAESVLLSFAGAVLGVLLALWSVDALVAASPVQIPRLKSVSVDRAVLLFTMAASMATGILFGLIPAVHLSRADGAETLKDAGKGSSGARSARMRQFLVVAEVAASLVLLAIGGLLLRSLAALQHVDPGFVPEHTVTVELSLPQSRYPDAAAQVAFTRRLLDRMRTLPGASASAVATTLPMSGSDLGMGFTIEGRPEDAATQPSAAYFSVSADYFAAMGIRLVKGRVFNSGDRAESPSAVIISESLARRYWPGEDPIGKHLTLGYNHTGAREIVGIVGDVKNVQLAENTHPALYTAFEQAPWPFLAVVARTSGAESALLGSLRTAIVNVDPDQPVGRMQTVTEYVARSIATPRFTATLVGSFATTALLLAGFGLFSVMAYSVAQRRREIGIRVALGAQAGNLRWMVVGQALRLGSVGLGLGLIGAFAAARVLDSLLFGVSANDPFTFTGVCAMLLVVLMAAAYLPARRATRVDPIVALRD